jgi:hypothetical protein
LIDTLLATHLICLTCARRSRLLGGIEVHLPKMQGAKATTRATARRFGDGLHPTQAFVFQEPSLAFYTAAIAFA